MSVNGPDAVRAAEIDLEAQALHLRLAELHGERATLPGSLGAASVNGAATELSWVADSYGAAVESLPDLGFSEQQVEEGVPTLERVQEALVPVSAWLGMRTRNGHEHEVIIAPNVQRIGLIGSGRWPGLIPRFDKLQGEDDRTIIRPSLWTQRPDKDPLYDGAPDADRLPLFSVAILLGDISDPVNIREAANLYNDPGGVYPDLCADEQRFMLLNEKVAHGLAGRRVEGVTIGQVIASNARRRRDSQPFLSTATVTRLVGHPDKEVVSPEGNAVDWTPAVRAVGQRQELGGVGAELMQDDVVIRRVLRLDFSK